MRVTDLEAIRIKIASPEDILSWSYGEVTKPETINYRTQKAEKDGLFCERIFGPEKDYECYCGKYRRIRYKGIICDRCGVEVTKSSVRRERMGHIGLACPVSHIWFLRGVPSRIGMVLDIPMQQLEKVIYFAAYIITKIDEEAKKRTLEEIEKEFNMKKKARGSELKDEKLKEAIEELKEAKSKAKEEIESIKLLKILSEVEYYDYSLKYGDIFEAGTGAETLRKIFEKVDLKKELENLKGKKEEENVLERRKSFRRLRFLQSMHKAGIRPEWMFMTKIPVLPPDLRPMVQLDGGRYASSDLNDLYRRVINRNNRLKYLLEISAPEVIVRNEKRMLQEAVDALIDNSMRKGILTTATTGGRRLLKSLADMLKGKQGRFRQNLLGKRVDYSGRSVIVVGPKLQLHQTGLPKKMALELFKPFVIQQILEKELAYNVRGASKLIDQGIDEVWAILEEVVKGKVVLLNRAPTLHRLGIQAFQPVLIEGESIKVHPLVCKAFNADFDGDQMAVHVPLSEEAQKEAREIMLSSRNLLKPATGMPIVSPTQDIILGCYWLTRIEEGAKGENKVFSGEEEALIARDAEAVDLRAKIKVRMKEGMVETSVGRIIFNEALPEDYPFVNDLMKSKKLEKIMSGIILKYPSEIVEQTLDKVKNLGFEYATISGVSWGMDDLIVPPQKEEILEKAQKEIEMIESHFKKGLLSREEKSSKVIEVWTRVKSEIEKLVPETLSKKGSIYTIIDSGARGSWSQPVQMAGMKGLVINPAGQIIELPVRSSFKEGFDVLEFFISTHGARKGTADTALRTSTAGYLTRRLVDVAHEVIVMEEDCGDKEGFKILRSEADELGQDFSYKIAGRISLYDIKSKGKTIVKKGEIIDWDKADEIIEHKIEEIIVRSPISCKSKRGICRKCYGWDLGSNKLVEMGEAVGVIAAQAIGEPGTQLTMRTFHTGGVAGGSDITFGLPRVQEIFEARTPGGKAEISKVDGKVIEITPEKVIRIKVKDPKKKDEVAEYKIPEKTGIFVKEGDEVKKGQQFCEGSIDLKDLFKIKGKEDVQKYVAKEIQKIYVSQGAVIHDKHIEIIIKQMFSRVKIKDSGNSSYLAGEVMELPKVLEENEILEKAKKMPIKYQNMLLGISRVALTTDSFLSSASFQETSRVLIKASLEGKEDKLRGLKENVIIGKLIPAGTGFKK
ncbi:MAG: DNA-directed RNA polymerase subunit beta' [Candidatus Nealsonbacteria bacterium RIFOXYB1_FULL_40_15]|uniref:DNA-directed RNA polymerase subunit beta' n=2 Tax=Candidatus Nealsoniibacteriota TaxID=1817911 RepID=A0A1G2EUD5_9BACT|nr:MAG: DNA-directed RNA polymerase subunit beta' [Candidatus Nealsonbacteria bacterium RIFOXYB1_FULL_40_15]OGZ28878.1 MAG: DNA-directed RNA polymerase subunit beta' [Candidatus Nealsonbacteria bacterium RIFOXYC1_FULL_40_7]OGZ29131.1 MAG: DNA-directed RNA polymerase subunit beta' [Candidatus Nealsonbacteria bacterium RIFOXYD1_FULL_39_11]